MIEEKSSDADFGATEFEAIRPRENMQSNMVLGTVSAVNLKPQACMGPWARWDSTAHTVKQAETDQRLERRVQIVQCSMDKDRRALDVQLIVALFVVVLVCKSECEIETRRRTHSQLACFTFSWSSRVAAPDETHNHEAKRARLLSL